MVKKCAIKKGLVRLCLYGARKQIPFILDRLKCGWFHQGTFEMGCLWQKIKM